MIKLGFNIHLLSLAVVDENSIPVEPSATRREEELLAIDVASNQPPTLPTLIDPTSDKTIAPIEKCFGDVDENEIDGGPDCDLPEKEDKKPEGEKKSDAKKGQSKTGGDNGCCGGADSSKKKAEKAAKKVEAEKNSDDKGKPKKGGGDDYCGTGDDSSKKKAEKAAKSVEAEKKEDDKGQSKTGDPGGCCPEEDECAKKEREKKEAEKKIEEKQQKPNTGGDTPKEKKSPKKRKHFTSWNAYVSYYTKVSQIIAYYVLLYAIYFFEYILYIYIYILSEERWKRIHWS